MERGGERQTDRQKQRERQRQRETETERETERERERGRKREMFKIRLDVLLNKFMVHFEGANIYKVPISEKSLKQRRLQCIHQDHAHSLDSSFLPFFCNSVINDNN